MIRRAALLLLLPAALTASEPLDALGKARADADAAAKRQQVLEKAAGEARGEAATLAAKRQAAAAGIDLAEARIAASGLELAEARLRQRQAEDQLADARAPAAALVAGVVTMARRPPLLVLADGVSIKTLVHTQALLDAGLPVIRARSAGLVRKAAAAKARTGDVMAAAGGLRSERATLDDARHRFAALERQAETRAASLEGGAFLAADRVIAGGEDVDRLGRAGERASAARKAAALLSRLEPLPPRPGGATRPTGAPLAYALPGAWNVTEGMGAVSDIGVASRGITFAAPRGAAVMAPADGKVLFAGPFRTFDGMIIIGHDGGWTSLLTNVRPTVEKGATVHIGDPIGTALGPVDLELREKNRWRSPALIARSSVSLSNGASTR